MLIHLLLLLGGFLAGASTAVVMFRYFAIRELGDVLAAAKQPTRK